jgi:hypothetical protein
LTIALPIESVILLAMETLPNWLEPAPQQATTDTPTSLVKYPRTQGELTYQELTFENFFLAALDRIALGHPLLDIVSDDPRDIPPVEFMRWMRKDKSRKEQWREAEEIAAEILIMQTVGIAAGTDSPMEDTNRSQLRVGNNWKIAAAYSPKRFGKEVGLSTSGMGSGGIVINIGTVESPYANSIDVVPADNDHAGLMSDTVTDVEIKE